jgi:hypothetical protein
MGSSKLLRKGDRVGEPPTPHEVCFVAEIMAFERELWDDALIKHETGHRQLLCQV